MSFQTAKKTVITLMAVIVVFCVTALIMRGSNEPVAAILSYSALALLAFLTSTIFKWLRCPYCGKVLLRKLVWLKVCPECKRNLDTGLREKKKSKGGVR